MTAMPPRLAILISFSGYGGVERMVLNLLQGFAEHDLSIDLLTIRRPTNLKDELPPTVRLLDLGVSHSMLAVPALVRYLRQNPSSGIIGR
ncbi:MAG: glycosyltransferase [Candidatus Competibacteraceae bacterium]|nr:glycosyltransferase [Candidatus Competibacteraceae bacterium]